ncbi:MAG: S-layer homology domain-containing protein, partial [Clostridia bacterium]|nr:S-layer homology domain-containing protein [Clostridia bacterium]
PEGLAGGAITATDESEIPFWAKESMKVVVTQGILNGYPDRTLKPSRSVTRAEAVKILFSILGIGK